MKKLTKKQMNKENQEKILLEVEFSDKGSIEHHIEGCEGKHIQQVIYSTYHKALTQICFGCKKIRTSLRREDLTK